MSITATSVAGSASAWLGVIDFPAELVVGFAVAIGIIGLGIGLFKARRAGKGRA